MTIVTRKDLKPGQQAVQAIHAGIDFCFKHPEVAKDWHNLSNYLAFLSVEDESCLIELIRKLNEANIRHCVFIEPDLENSITAVAIEPHEDVKKFVSNLPLALKQVENKCYV